MTTIWSIFPCLLIFFSLPVFGDTLLPFLFPPSSFLSSVHLCLFYLCTEILGYRSRMCARETIVRESRWQETRLRKMKISILFLTTSFHFLPGNILLFFILIQTGKKREPYFDLLPPSINYDRLYFQSTGFYKYITLINVGHPTTSALTIQLLWVKDLNHCLTVSQLSDCTFALRQ